VSPWALWLLIRRDLGRARGALVTSGFGIAAGTAALVFFLALGLGVRGVLLGDVFPIDKVELEPKKAEDPGLLGLLTKAKPPGIAGEKIERLRALPYVKAIYPKLRFAFPSSARGGKELLGQDVGTSEMIGDGIDPALVREDAKSGVPFEDPLKNPGPACKSTADCQAPQYCEGPAAEPVGVCSDPVPVLASRYLVEIFDKTLAPAHGWPPIGETLLNRAKVVVFRLWLGESLLGKAKLGGPRHVNARVVGISTRAIDIGITIPIEVVRRWNREYSGEAAAEEYSSVLVQVHEKDDTSRVIALGAELGLEPKDTRARDVSVLVTSVMALLGLVAGIILVVSASNIAYTFRVLVNDRRSEIALYRAVGASARDMVSWLIGLALTVGVSAGAVGVLVARLVAVGADYLARTRIPEFPFKPQSFFSFSPGLVLGALGFAALFALLGAFGPARRAGRVDPAAALAAL
jgi:putative ABC transport system permease protein